MTTTTVHSPRAGATIDLILKAAERIILRDGVLSLTLEAVAQEAGVSKGGLLYHFRSKTALIKAMIDRQLDLFEQDLEREMQRDPRTPGRWLRAYVRACLLQTRRAPETCSGLLAAAVLDPELLAPLRERAEEWQRQAEQDGMDPAVGTLIRLAADGIWLAEFFGLARPREPLREQVVDELFALATVSA